MDTIKAKRENYLKMDYSSKYIELNSHNLLNLPDFVENCLKILENFTLMLLGTNEKLYSKPKLSYCYCYFNAIRWQLENTTTMQRSLIIEIAKSVITRLQNSLGFLDVPIDYHTISEEYKKSRCIRSRVLTKNNICRKKSKRKSKYMKKPEETLIIDNVKESFSKLNGDLSRPSNDSINNNKALTIQHIIDQMYIQTRAVLCENCIGDANIFTEPSRLFDDVSCKIITEANQLPTIMRPANKYPEELWSGDCKINDDCSHIFDKLISSNNGNFDVTSLTDKIFSSNAKNRSRKDSELDEGFSENEFLYDVDNKFECNDSSECLPYEQFSYCGDCHYNSSNSKSNEADFCIDFKSVPDIHNDDGSDSDGGTELLNSVNETLDKFNAFMQHILTTDNNPQLAETSSNYTTKCAEQSMIENLWPCRNQSTSDIRILLESNPVTSLQKKPFDQHELLIFESNPPTSPLLDNIICKDDKCDTTIPTISNPQSLSPVSSLSKYNCESVSKLLVSPINTQNWCSYNLSPITSPSCSFSYHSKPPPVNVDGNSSTVDRFCTGKLSSWLPPISHGLISANSYIIGSNHPQQPIHRIMLSSHLTVPPGNMNAIQHNVVHLPQIFHQIPHTMMDSDYFDLRQMSLNQQQTQFSNPNNNNSSCDFLLSPANLLSNSNCSNITVTTSSHQPMSIIKSSLDKSQRACCFYMRGGCKKEDCEYAHDLSKVTCKFWEKGDCFKADTCPFKHGYMKE